MLWLLSSPLYLMFGLVCRAEQARLVLALHHQVLVLHRLLNTPSTASQPRGYSREGIKHISRVAELRRPRSVQKLIRAPKFPESGLTGARHPQTNPVLRSFADRLREAGKPTMVIIGAVMREPLHLAFGVLKTQQPFDPNYEAGKA